LLLSACHSWGIGGARALMVHPDTEKHLWVFIRKSSQGLKNFALFPDRSRT
jgi:hypothetical protein